MSEKGGGKIPVNIFDKSNPNLNTSYEVKKAIELAKYDGDLFDENKKSERLKPYMGEGGQLEKIFNNPNEEDRQRRITKYKEELLYPTVLIDKNNIPDSYFELQLKIARERGQGGDLGKIKTVADIDQQTRLKEGETIHNDQKKSLDNWIDYLSSADAQYPTWFKYYTLTSISKMGVYDKEKHEFSKRTKETTTIFPDLNREALAYTYDALEKYYLKHEKHDNDELQKIIEGANFSKIYAFAIDKATPASKENKEKTQGEWTKFNQGDDATALYESLQGHGTGWCTAGQETAKSQLKGGDFYVYYSKDEKGKNTIPRIAIRMENNQVAEVRGIEKDQNMEASMTDIAKEKYHQLPGGEKFDKKDSDMKQLTLIDNKVKNNQELNQKELVFLYQIDSKIEGFGYKADPRIKEVVGKRISKLDAPIVFGCQPNEIAWSREELNNETKAYIAPLFPGIFKDYQNLENIYTSFPEGKIHCESLTVGGKSTKQLELELKQNKIKVEDYAKQILLKPEFKTLKSPEVFDLINLKVSDLGFIDDPTTEQLYETAKQFGLELCPPEVGPELLLKYKDQPSYENKFIAMKKIADSSGRPDIFMLRCEDEYFDYKRLEIRGVYALGGDRWHLYYEVVFSLRK